MLKLYTLTICLKKLSIMTVLCNTFWCILHITFRGDFAQNKHSWINICNLTLSFFCIAYIYFVIYDCILPLPIKSDLALFGQNAENYLSKNFLRSLSVSSAFSNRSGRYFAVCSSACCRFHFAIFA